MEATRELGRPIAGSPIDIRARGTDNGWAGVLGDHQSIKVVCPLLACERQLGLDEKRRTVQRRLSKAGEAMNDRRISSISQ
jgi:hypothetical protein